jgi:hypothetical protein
VFCSQRGGFSTAVVSVLYTGGATFAFKWLFTFRHEAEWAPFQTLYCSENLVALGIDPGPLDFVARNPDH